MDAKLLIKKNKIKNEFMHATQRIQQKLFPIFLKKTTYFPKFQ